VIKIFINKISLNLLVILLCNGKKNKKKYIFIKTNYFSLGVLKSYVLLCCSLDINKVFNNTLIL
jgi:hypothetical protein